MFRFHGALFQFLFFGCLLITQPASAHGPVSLLVQEALPNDPKASKFTLRPGIDRVQAPITFGIPFPPDTTFFEANQIDLALDGLSYENAQFHIEQRWPSRRIKWLRVHMQLNLKANQQNKDMVLKAGTSTPSTARLLSEEGDHYVIDTGKAKFWVNKKRFGLFDKVEVDGKALLADTPQPGIVLKDTTGEAYEAARHTKVAYEVEDNGPFYVALVAKGKHVSKDGKDLLDFTVRMHFYKGKQRVKLVYTLRNASKDRLENVTFQSAELRFKAAWTKPSYLVRHHEGEAKGDLTEAAKLRLFQGENAFPTIRGKGFEEKHWPTGIKGYKLTLDGKDLKQGDREQYISLFYAQARHADGRAIMVGTRFAAGYWPQSLGLDGDGTLSIGLFPEGNDKTYTIRFGSHLTRECVISFAAKAEASPRDQFYRFQYPVVAKPITAEWFNAEGMFTWRLVSFLDEEAFSKQRKWPTDNGPSATANRRPSFAVVRHLDNSADVPGNQFSPGLLAGFNFLREGALRSGAYYLQAEQWMRYNADHSAFKSDDYDYNDVLGEVPKLKGADGKVKSYTALPGADKLPTTSPLWTPQNLHAHGLAFWSRAVGNRRQFRAYFDWGETLKFQEGDKAAILSNPRAFGWYMFNQGDYVANTGLLSSTDVVASFLEAIRYKAPGPTGEAGAINSTRGYYTSTAQSEEPAPTLQTWALASVLSWAFALHANNESNLKKSNAARDLLEATAHFVADELWYKGGDAPGDQGTPATYKPAKAPGDPRKASDWHHGLQDAYSALYYGYILTCDKAFREKGEALLKLTAHNPGNIDWIQDRPGRQMMQYLLQKPEMFALWHPLKLTVKREGKKHTISWSKPEYATLYRIKYGNKTIVNSLGFNPQTRAYKNDPKNHISFWAATDVPDLPNAGDVSPNETQQVVVQLGNETTEYSFAGRFRSIELCGRTTVDTQPEPTPEPSKEPSTVDKDGGTHHDTPATDSTPKTGCKCNGSGSEGIPFGLCLLLLAAIFTRRRSNS